MFKLFSCLCCQNVDLNEERMDTRLLTRFPSTYHLRTLFDEYQYSNDSEVSEGSEIGEIPEDQNEDSSEVPLEDKYENPEHTLQEGPSLNGSRMATEKSEMGVMDINNRSSLNTSSGSNTNRSKQSKRNKKRSYRR